MNNWAKWNHPSVRKHGVTLVLCLLWFGFVVSWLACLVLVVFLFFFKKGGDVHEYFVHMFESAQGELVLGEAEP